MALVSQPLPPAHEFPKIDGVEFQLPLYYFASWSIAEYAPDQNLILAYEAREHQLTLRRYVGWPDQWQKLGHLLLTEVNAYICDYDTRLRLLGWRVPEKREDVRTYCDIQFEDNASMEKFRKKLMLERTNMVCESMVSTPEEMIDIFRKVPAKAASPEAKRTGRAILGVDTCNPRLRPYHPEKACKGDNPVPYPYLEQQLLKIGAPFDAWTTMNTEADRWHDPNWTISGAPLGTKPWVSKDMGPPLIPVMPSRTQVKMVRMPRKAEPKKALTKLPGVETNRVEGSQSSVPPPGEEKKVEDSQSCLPLPEAISTPEFAQRTLLDWGRQEEESRTASQETSPPKSPDPSITKEKVLQSPFHTPRKHVAAVGSPQATALEIAKEAVVTRTVGTHNVLNIVPSVQQTASRDAQQQPSASASQPAPQPGIPQAPHAPRGAPAKSAQVSFVPSNTQHLSTGALLKPSTQKRPVSDIDRASNAPLAKRTKHNEMHPHQVYLNRMHASQMQHPNQMQHPSQMLHPYQLHPNQVCPNQAYPNQVYPNHMHYNQIHLHPQMQHNQIHPHPQMQHNQMHLHPPMPPNHLRPLPQPHPPQPHQNALPRLQPHPARPQLSAEALHRATARFQDVSARIAYMMDAKRGPEYLSSNMQELQNLIGERDALSGLLGGQSGFRS